MAATTTQQIEELARRWAQAEQGADIATLDELTVDDFTLVGPVGFTLDKAQWLDRYRPGGLRTDKLVWDELTVREYGDTAIVIGRHTQEARIQDHQVDGSFRATHVAVRRDGRWLLAGIHLSPIGVFAPPPVTPAATPAG